MAGMRWNPEVIQERNHEDFGAKEAARPVSKTGKKRERGKAGGQVRRPADTDSELRLKWASAVAFRRKNAVGEAESAARALTRHSGRAIYM